jgi:mannose-1-phosphate guanylyltransferase/mannose-6-phosphate isomerase
MSPDLAAVQPVILAGGAGRRLWPLSRPGRPKPFLRIAPGGRTLLQATVLRVAGMLSPLVVGAVAHRDMILADFAGIGVRPGRLLLEPAGRGTAPALAAAAYLCAHGCGEGDDPLLLVLPSDHRIDDGAAFLAAVERGIPHARDGAIVTFGMTIRRAETRYGYIRRGAALAGGAAKIDGFVEKPIAARARDFRRDGRHEWNSGIFLMRARTALAVLPPAVATAVQAAVSRAAARQESVLLDAAAWAGCPLISIDRGIMEQTDRGVVVPAEMGWTDVGTWPALLGTLRR